MSLADAYDSVRKASTRERGLDVWVMSRDEAQARQYILYCKHLARTLKYAACDLGEQILLSEEGKEFKARQIQFASGASIYALSSNVDAIAGKTGHVKLDEFALHKDQRNLFAVAKPVTQWGGTLSIISTHRGAATVFNQLIQKILRSAGLTSTEQRAAPKSAVRSLDGWSLHSIPIQRAVTEGLVERINKASGRNETREQWLTRQRAECLDEEQWLQEYCCTPADENSAFISYELLNRCAGDDLVLCSPDELIAECARKGQAMNPLYLGMDVARVIDLCVLDVGEKIGDVMHDRVRIELHNRPFPEIRWHLWRLLRLRALRRCCIDHKGLGMEMAEDAQREFGWKVEPVEFTPQTKERLAFGLRQDFEEKRLKIPRDDKLWADLHGIKKTVTPSGNIRLDGSCDDSHCDRFWAKALRQEAARQPGMFFSSTTV